MNVTILRRALWVVAAVALGYAVYAYWVWSPLELIAAAGVFIILIPVDMLLHREEMNRQLPPHGPVRRFGYREPIVYGRGPTPPRRSLFERLTPWWVWVLMIGVVPSAAALCNAGAAHSDVVSELYVSRYATMICSLLDYDPTDAQVLAVLQAMHNDGLTLDQAGTPQSSPPCNSTAPGHMRTLAHFAKPEAPQTSPRFEAGQQIGGALR